MAIRPVSPPQSNIPLGALVSLATRNSQDNFANWFMRQGTSHFFNTLQNRQEDELMRERQALMQDRAALNEINMGLARGDLMPWTPDVETYIDKQYERANLPGVDPVDFNVQGHEFKLMPVRALDTARLIEDRKKPVLIGHDTEGKEMFMPYEEFSPLQQAGMLGQVQPGGVAADFVYDLIQTAPGYFGDETKKRLLSQLDELRNKTTTVPGTDYSFTGPTRADTNAILSELGVAVSFAQLRAEQARIEAAGAVDRVKLDQTVSAQNVQRTQQGWVIGKGPNGTVTRTHPTTTEAAQMNVLLQNPFAGPSHVGMTPEYFAYIKRLNESWVPNDAVDTRTINMLDELEKGLAGTENQNNEYLAQLLDPTLDLLSRMDEPHAAQFRNFIARNMPEYNDDPSKVLLDDRHMVLRMITATGARGSAGSDLRKALIALEVLNIRTADEYVAMIKSGEVPSNFLTRNSMDIMHTLTNGQFHVRQPELLNVGSLGTSLRTEEYPAANTTGTNVAPMTEMERVSFRYHVGTMLEPLRAEVLTILNRRKRDGGDGEYEAVRRRFESIQTPEAALAFFKNLRDSLPETRGGGARGTSVPSEREQMDELVKLLEHDPFGDKWLALYDWFQELREEWQNLE